MRRFLPIALTAAAGSLAVTGTLAFAQVAADRESLSSEEGALLPPEHWECGLYVKEYEDFLAAGNDPASWRFAGKRYRSAGDGERYDWRGWLEWYEDAECASALPANGSADGVVNPAGSGAGGSGNGNVALYAVGGLALAGLLAAAAGGGGGDEVRNNKSPG